MGSLSTAPRLQCQDSRGMWQDAMSDVHKCVPGKEFSYGSRWEEGGSTCGAS